MVDDLTHELAVGKVALVGNDEDLNAALYDWLGRDFPSERAPKREITSGVMLHQHLLRRPNEEPHNTRRGNWKKRSDLARRILDGKPLLERAASPDIREMEEVFGGIYKSASPVGEEPITNALPAVNI